MDFRNSRRGTGDFRSEKLHFAPTFPLRRRGNPTGALCWLETDPRPGLESDLIQVAPGMEILPLLHVWTDAQKAFGIEESRRGRNATGDDKLRLYVCPAARWHGLSKRPLPSTREDWREALAAYLRREERHWAETREGWDLWRSRRLEEHEDVPWHGSVVDAASTLETMEEVPYTAVGMWLFPVEVFDRELVDVRENSYDLRDTRPGLILFEF